MDVMSTSPHSTALFPHAARILHSRAPHLQTYLTPFRTSELFKSSCLVNKAISPAGQSYLSPNQPIMGSPTLPFSFSDSEDDTSDGTITLPGEQGLLCVDPKVFSEALGTSDEPFLSVDGTLIRAEGPASTSEDSFVSDVTNSGSCEETSNMETVNAAQYGENISFDDNSVTGFSEDHFIPTSISASQVSHFPLAAPSVEPLSTFDVVTSPLTDWSFDLEDDVALPDVGSAFNSARSDNAIIRSEEFSLNDPSPVALSPAARRLWNCNVSQRTVHRSRRQPFEHMIPDPFNIDRHQVPICLICNTTFHTVGELKNHRRRYHPKPKLFNCYDPKCETRFSAKCNLSKHFKSVHQKIRPYNCTMCTSTFSERNKLVKHRETVHRGSRPFVCQVPDCRKTFGQKSDCTRHYLVVHQGQRRYKCGDCVKNFGRKSSLSQHVIRIHKVDKDEVKDIMNHAIGDGADSEDGITVYPNRTRNLRKGA